jgi:hypothetical protein
MSVPSLSPRCEQENKNRQNYFHVASLISFPHRVQNFQQDMVFAKASYNSNTLESQVVQDVLPIIMLTSAPSIACFWIMLVPLGLAVVCSFFILYHFLFDRTMRASLSNHVFIALLLVGLLYLLFDIPNYLNFVRLGAVWPQSRILCYVWCFIDLAGFNVTAYLMLWSTSDCHLQCSMTGSLCQTEAAFASAHAIAQVSKNDSTTGPVLRHLSIILHSNDIGDCLSYIRCIIRDERPIRAVFILSRIFRHFLHTIRMPWNVSGNYEKGEGSAEHHTSHRSSSYSPMKNYVRLTIRDLFFFLSNKYDTPQWYLLRRVSIV